MTFIHENESKRKFWELLKLKLVLKSEGAGSNAARRHCPAAAAPPAFDMSGKYHDIYYYVFTQWKYV